MARLNNIRDNLADFIWPRLTGCPEKKPEFRGLNYYLSHELLAETKNMLILRITQVEERSDAVDRKLLSLFRTASLLATVAIAIFVGATNLQAVDDTIWTLIVYLSVLIILYIFFQLCFAVNATMKGLRAGRYQRLHRDSLIPANLDTTYEFNNRLIENLIHIVESNEWATNRKVDQMELAYTALRNVLWGLGALMGVALTLAVNILFFSVEI